MCPIFDPQLHEGLEGEPGVTYKFDQKGRKRTVGILATSETWPQEQSEYVFK